MRTVSRLPRKQVWGTVGCTSRTTATHSFAMVPQTSRYEPVAQWAQQTMGWQRQPRSACLLCLPQRVQRLLVRGTTNQTVPPLSAFALNVRRVRWSSLQSPSRRKLQAAGQAGDRQSHNAKMQRSSWGPLTMCTFTMYRSGSRLSSTILDEIPSNWRYRLRYTILSIVTHIVLPAHRARKLTVFPMRVSMHNTYIT